MKSEAYRNERALRDNDPIKALVVLGHAVPDSFNHAIAQEIESAWRGLQCSVALLDLVKLSFDPRLTAGEARGHPTGDPMVSAHIDLLRAADLLAFVHPNCWGAPPAIMKGWIDRVFAPGVAYAFEKGEDAGDAPIGLLKTRAALVVNTGNTEPTREQEIFGDPLDRMWRHCILRYCGVASIRRHLFGVIATSTHRQRLAWLAEVRQSAEMSHSELTIT